jgi:hypothetical protein
MKRKGFTVFLSALIVLCLLIPVFIAGYYEGKLRTTNKNMETIQTQIDSINGKLSSKEQQRVFDSFSYWILTLNEEELNNLQKKTNEYNRNNWDLGCIINSKEFVMDRNHFEFQVDNRWFDVSRDGSVNCFRNFQLIDCGVLCK